MNGRVTLDTEKLESAVIEIKEEPKLTIGSYFTRVGKENIKFIHSGCKLLDCVLGGGWPLGRISNVVGDKSSGKSLLAMEACTNFSLTYPSGKIYYMESEAAFDQDYAAALGMPVDKIDFIDQDENTVEEFYEILENVIKEHLENKKPGLFILDSLDALSDRAELDRKIDEGSYGTGKPKKLSELFRRLVSKVEKTNIHIMIISQIRENIGVMAGAKYSRSGGKALDFYASQVLWLKEIKKHKKVSNKIERIVGIQVEANCKKNKIGLPYRECEFPIYLGYGVDDITAHIEFLAKTDHVHLITDLTDGATTLEGRKISNVIRKIRSMNKEDTREAREMLNNAIIETWEEIETSFMPEQSKY